MRKGNSIRISINDYESGLRHNLEAIEVFDEHGIMLNLVPKYKGMG